MTQTMKKSVVLRPHPSVFGMFIVHRAINMPTLDLYQTVSPQDAVQWVRERIHVVTEHGPAMRPSEPGR